MEENKILESEEVARNFNLTSYKKSVEKMIATNELAYHRNWDYYYNRKSKKEYSLDEIHSIINSGSLSDQQTLSRNFFDRDGYYKQIILYYATLLKYAGILIPNPTFGSNLSKSAFQKKYYAALTYLDDMHIPTMFTEISQKVLVDGCYYGLKISSDKDNFQLLDIPQGYARTRYKDVWGNDIIEFNLSYFSRLSQTERNLALEAYPKCIVKAWKIFSKGKTNDPWFNVPKEIGVCFPLFNGIPPFLSVIPATLEYDQAIVEQRERDADEIKKIIVQKIPHLNDGRLVFEPDEAQEMHEGSVQMLSDNKNISVLTTYGDVSAVASNVRADRSVDTLDRMEQNIFAQGGVSSQIFATTNSGALGTSNENDLAFMCYLAGKYSKFITDHINQVFGNKSFSFKYTILPISYFNEQKFIDTNYKLVSSGYSFLLPALAQGLTAKDLMNVKYLENEILNLKEVLMPLGNSFTSGSESGKGSSADAEEGGRPELEDGDKSDKTLQNIESKDKTGGI